MTPHAQAPEALSAPEVRRRAVGGVMSIALRGFVMRVAGLLGNLVLARLLTPRDFGAVAFGFTLIAFGTFLADGGIGAMLIQRREDPTQRELRALQGFILLVSSLAFLVIAAIGLPLGRTGTLAAVMAVSLPIASFKVPSAVVIERRMFYRPLVRTDIAETVVYNGLAIGLVVAGLGVWGLVIATVVRAVAGTALLLATGGVGFLLPSFSFRTIRPFLSFGLQFQAVNVMNTVRDQGLNLVTAAIGGLSVLGIWSLANRVLQGIMLVFESLWRVSFPAITRLIETGESPQPSIERALALMTTFTGFVVAAIGGTAPALVPVAFGGAWQDAVPVLPWAAAGILLAGPVSTSTVGLLYARGRPGTVLVAVVAHSITWFAVAVPLLPSLGAESLGIGWCVAAIVDVAILGRALAQYRVGVISQCAPTVLLTVAAGVAGWVVATTVRPAGLALAASVLCVEALYLGSMIALRRAVVLDMFRLLRRGMSRGGTVGEPAAS